MDASQSQRSWTPPDGLERSRPREVRLTRGGRALLQLAAALWLGAPGAWVGLELQARAQADAQRLFRERAVAANGAVTRLWPNRGESRRHWMAYSFSAKGRSYARAVELRSGARQTLRVGSSIALRYLPSNPDVSYPAGTEPTRMPAFVPYLAAAALAACGGLLLLPLRSQRRLLAEGRAAQARVTRHVKDKHGTTVHFEFAALSGARVLGHSGPRSNPPPVGSPVCVLYDSDQPGRSAVYPLSLVAPLNRRPLRAAATGR